jgi:prolyl-tRNA editing enzyme YbaK/EbsC (Cys-tRNA(Pro) deacylase)
MLATQANGKRCLKMAIERFREYISQWDMDHQIMEFDTSSATVELAAAALNCTPARIAKTLSFKNDDHCIIVVTAGDAKIDNAKFKNYFGMKAKMLTPDEVISFTGHAVGGVCPFGIDESVKVYTDISMLRFETVYPACGSSNSAIQLNCEQLFKFSNSKAWVDVCKDWQA